ncbi:MAG: hypothetical protein HY235_02360 [Acidobacteria bacterium]|nr:hypothetical protein [Acidobacteriota bacterium]
MAERKAVEALRTPPTDAPLPDPPAPELPDKPALEDPPAAPEVEAEALLVMEPPDELLAELELREDEEDSPPPEEPPIDAVELPPPPLSPLLRPPIRPMNEPPPPLKLRLPRSWGPRMVTNFSGPVSPVRRIVLMRLPPAIVAVRIDAVEVCRFASASSARVLCQSHAPEAITVRTASSVSQRR